VSKKDPFEPIKNDNLPLKTKRGAYLVYCVSQNKMWRATGPSLEAILTALNTSFPDCVITNTKGKGDDFINLTPLAVTPELKNYMMRLRVKEGH
jgi:hypothetical protein